MEVSFFRVHLVSVRIPSPRSSLNDKCGQGVLSIAMSASANARSFINLNFYLSLVVFLSDSNVTMFSRPKPQAGTNSILLKMEFGVRQCSSTK